MKKLISALIISVFLSGTAFARQGLSVDLGIGINPDPGGVRNIEEKEGIKGINPSGYSDSGLPSRDRLNTLQGYGTVKDIEQKGAYQAIDLSLSARYDFVKFLFARAGFNYTKQMDTELTWKFTGAQVSGSASSAAYDSRQTQKYAYQSFTVPLTFGLNIPVEKGKYDLYAGLGPSYISGKFSLDVDAPAGAFGSLFYSSNGQPALHDNLTANFNAFGMNYIIGVDAALSRNFYLFAEIQYDYFSVINGNTSKTGSLNGFFNTSSSGKIAIPLNLNDMIARFGVRYQVF